MNLNVHFHIHWNIPQLDGLVVAIEEGFASMSEATDRLTQAVTETMADLTMTLDTEITQIADALAQAGGDPALVDAQAQRLLAFRDSFKVAIANIIPDTPPIP